MVSVLVSVSKLLMSLTFLDWIKFCIGLQYNTVHQLMRNNDTVYLLSFPSRPICKLQHMYRVLFKLAVTVHRWLNGRAPPYLSDYYLPIAGADSRRICVSPTVNYLQYLATGSTLMAVRPFHSRSHGLEVSSGFHPGPDHQCRLFQTFA